MVTLIDALKNNDNAYIRVECGYRWLTWDSTQCMWIVREHNPSKRNVKTIIETPDEKSAIDYLIAE